jgi:hypothetical protein
MQEERCTGCTFLRQPSADLGTQHLLTVTMLFFSQNPVRAA